MYASQQYRYGVFIRFTLATGVRLGELLGLRWEDIDTKTCMVTIRRTINRLPKVDYNGIGNSTEIVIQEPKTKNSIRSFPQHNSYPVIVTPSANGFILNTVDFEDLSVEADNIQYGISCIHSAISQRMMTSLLPEPTPASELALSPADFVVMVTV